MKKPFEEAEIDITRMEVEDATTLLSGWPFFGSNDTEDGTTL